MADVTTDRLVRQIDWEPTRVNALSASIAVAHSRARALCQRSRMPAVGCGNGRESWTLRDVTYGWIRNTLELDRVAISHNLRADVTGTIEGEIDVKWDDADNLVSPFM